MSLAPRPSLASAFVAGLGAGLVIALVMRAVETSRLALGPYAFYGNGALIVPAIGAGVAIYALWTPLLRGGAGASALLVSVIGLELGIGAYSVLSGGGVGLGLLLAGIIFVAPAAITAYLVTRTTGPMTTGALQVTALAGVVLTGLGSVLGLGSLGIGIVAGAFAVAGLRARGRATIMWLGIALFVTLLVASLAIPLLFLR